MIKDYLNSLGEYRMPRWYQIPSAIASRIETQIMFVALVIGVFYGQRDIVAVIIVSWLVVATHYYRSYPDLLGEFFMLNHKDVMSHPNVKIFINDSHELYLMFQELTAYLSAFSGMYSKASLTSIDRLVKHLIDLSEGGDLAQDVDEQGDFIATLSELDEVLNKNVQSRTNNGIMVN